nr:hypothetical protein [Tanacetum cinerariifolium]
MKAHCVNLELKYQNQAVKSKKHGQFLKANSNEAKVKHDINVIETINIELEHKVAKLLKENETLKKRYKELWKQTGRIFNTVGLRWVPTRKIFTSSITTIDSEPFNGSNTDITNLHECIQNLDSTAGTSIKVQEEQTLALNVGTPFNLKKERIKVWIKENVISERLRLHRTTLKEEISARQKSQGIRSFLTS